MKIWFTWQRMLWVFPSSLLRARSTFSLRALAACSFSRVAANVCLALEYLICHLGQFGQSLVVVVVPNTSGAEVIFSSSGFLALSKTHKMIYINILAKIWKRDVILLEFQLLLFWLFSLRSTEECSKEENRPGSESIPRSGERCKDVGLVGVLICSKFLPV